MGDLEARRMQAADIELDKMLSQATRLDADPAQSLANALRDPAAMRKLVQTFGKDPEMLGSLRRSVFDIAQRASEGGGSIASFLRNNERSLKVLFDGTKHYDDLVKLADIQERVFLMANVTGQVPDFSSLNENVKSLTGSSIQYLTTTTREAMVSRIRPETGAIMLFVRMASNTEQDLYGRIFLKALEDKKFADAITKFGTEEQVQKATKALESVGIFVPKVLGLDKAAQLEFIDAIKDQEPVPVERPQQPQSNIARQMLKALPPAPPVRGVPQAPQAPQGGQPPQAPGFQSSFPSATPPPQSVPLEQRYMSMFPNDPISAMLQQRMQMQQQPQQPQR
jgi:aromatic ring-cleaving dioxygenase